VGFFAFEPLEHPPSTIGVLFFFYNIPGRASVPGGRRGLGQLHWLGGPEVGHQIDDLAVAERFEQAGRHHRYAC